MAIGSLLGEQITLGKFILNGFEITCKMVRVNIKVPQRRVYLEMSKMKRW